LRLMKIAIDARWIFPQHSGIGQHTRLLIQGLHELNCGEEFLLIFQDAAFAEQVCEECAVDFPRLILPYALFSPWNQLRLMHSLRKHKVDVYHSTNYMIPVLPSLPAPFRHPRCLATLHDLIPIIYPDHAPESKKRKLFPIYVQLMKRIGRHADALITVSESSKQDLQKHLGLRKKDFSKIQVIPNGIHADFSPDERVERAAPPEILYVGRLDPYKNVPLLISGFYEAMGKLPQGSSLRIIGPRDDRYPEAEHLIERLDLQPWVHWEGHVTAERLLEAYRQASVLVLASEYEGFGLPVAEAMACGTPVICSDSSSLPEVGGRAARYVQPGSMNAIKEALIEVLKDTRLREGMVAEGLEQVKRFQAGEMARQTLDVYRGLL